MKKKLSFVYPAIFILLPVLLFGVITLIQCGRSGGGLFLPTPKWNDEAAYYELVKTWQSCCLGNRGSLESGYFTSLCGLGRNVWMGL